METIETADDYYEMIAKARNPPFTILKKSDYAVHDFEKLVSEKIVIPKDLRIRDAKRIVYFPNSHVDVFDDYVSESVNFKLESEIEFDDLLKTELASSIGISAAKINDVKSLLRFLSPKGKEFFNNLIRKSSLKVDAVKNTRNDCSKEESEKCAKKAKKTCVKSDAKTKTRKSTRNVTSTKKK